MGREAVIYTGHFPASSGEDPSNQLLSSPVCQQSSLAPPGRGGGGGWGACKQGPSSLVQSSRYQTFMEHLLTCSVQKGNGREARCLLSWIHVLDRGGGGQPSRNKIISDVPDVMEK